MKRFAAVFSALVVLGAGCAPVVREPVYNWRVEVVVCETCSPYERESISDHALRQDQDAFLAAIEGVRVSDDEPSQPNAFVLEATHEGKALVIEEKNSLSLPVGRVKSTHFELIVENQQHEPTNPDDVFACVTDDDCVPATDGCCGCSASGSVVAIHRDFQRYWSDERASECAAVSCLQSISNDPSCSASLRCVNNRCEMR